MDIQAAFKIVASVYGADAIDKLTRQLGQTAQAQGDVVSAGQRMIASLRDQVAQASMGSAEYQRYQAALAGVSKEANPLIATIERLKAETAAKAKADAEAAAAAKAAAAADKAAADAKDRFLAQLRDQIATQGKTTQEILAYKAAQMGISKEAAPLIEQLGKANGQLHATGISAAQTAAAMRTVPAQMTDIATQLAGGQSPFLILLQQGGQMKDSFGGIGPMFRALGSMITPAGVAMTALGVAVGAVAYAFQSGLSEAQQFQRTLTMTGNAAGVTADSYQALAKKLEETRNVSIGTSKELLTGLIQSGQVGSKALEPVASAMARVKQMSGESAASVVKDFSNMAGGVAKWAEEHNKSFNFLTVAQYKYIRDLEKQGKTEEAMAETGKLLDQALRDRGVEVTGLTKLWDDLSKAASRAWDQMKGALTESDQKRVDQLNADIANLEKQKSEGGRKGLFGEILRTPEQLQEELNDYYRERDAILAKIRAEKKKADDQAAEAKKNREGIAKVSSGQADAEEDAARELSLQKLKAASAERMNLIDIERAKLDAQRNKSLIDDQTFNNRKLELDRKALDEKITLAQQERDLEAKRDAVTKAEKSKKTARLVGMDSGIKDLKTQRDALTIAGTQAPKGEVSAYDSKMNSLGESAAALQFKLDWFGKYKEKLDSAQAAQVQFDIESGKMKDLTAGQKAALMEAAQKVDELSAAYARMQAGEKFSQETEKLTLRLKENKSALNELNVVQEAANAKQELANAGIREGTAEYQKLMAARQAVLDQANASKNDLFGGFAQGLKDWTQAGTNYFGQMREVATKTMDGMADALSNWITTGKFEFKDFARSIIADLAKIIAKQQIMAAMNAFMPGGGAGGGGAGGVGSVFQAAASFFGFAKGGAFEGGRHLFAQGGVFDTATPIRFMQGGRLQNGLMGEAGPEAIMPLERGANGKLGVRASGAGGGGGVTIGSIVIQSDGGSKAQDTSGRNAEALGRDLGAVIDQRITYHKRPGGLLFAG